MSRFDYYLSDCPATFPGVSDSDSPGFEEMLALAAEQFPLNDGKFMDDRESYAVSAPSPFTSSSGSSSAMSPPCHESNLGSDSESDSDVEPWCLDNTDHITDQPPRAQSLPTFEDDTPFLPQKGNTAFVPTSHLATARSKMRGARVRHAASHPPPAIIRPSPSNQCVHDPSHSISTVDLDHDADCESDGNATDDEYVPSPTLGPRKRRRASSAARKHPTKPSVARGPPSTSQSRPTKRARIPPPSRNKQATSVAVIELAVTSKDPTFICPECGWNQTNQRLPDFRRHLLTHTRSSEDADKGWWCKGVLVKDAAQYGIPKTAEQYLFRDKWRVGGCLRTFSRRDALKRHLDNSNVSCVGRPCEAADEP